MTARRTLRERRLFRDNGRALIVAMDHARSFNTITGLKDPNAVIKSVMSAGADAILGSNGTAKGAHEDLGNGGIWLSADTTPDTVVSTVEYALRLGVDGIKSEVYPWCTPENDRFGRRNGAETIVSTSCLAAECHKWGLPLLVEAVPFGWPAVEERTSETTAAACRIASEAGADYVKAFYTGDKTSFRDLVDNCTVPVVVLGGGKVDSDSDVLSTVSDAMEAGAVGVAIGRNIWGHDNVAGMTAALAAVIHDGADIDTAVKLI